MDDLFFDTLVFLTGCAIGVAAHGDDILDGDSDDDDGDS
jgi:hypothetical protein